MSSLPIAEQLLLVSQKSHAAFYAPGHKGGKGMARSLRRLWGDAIFSMDLPELPELDNLFAPEGIIQKAQELAAKTFGSDRTWFLINGSTCGVIAAILATCGPGDKILLPRNVHQSAIAGLIHSGAIPIFINPVYDSSWDLCYGITPESVANALRNHPDIKAIFVVYPTYQGVCCDLAAIAKLAQLHQIPLLVDEAHGPHFAFHFQLPASALSLGADISIQSTHKVLGAMTQASMLHFQEQKIDPKKISRALQLVQSTSPSYLLLASLDAAREQMATEGKLLLENTLNLAEKSRQKLTKISQLKMLEKNIRPGFFDLDQTRLTVDVSGLGFTGYEADEILHQQLGVTAELPLLKSLTFIITIGNNEADIEQLIQGFQQLATMTPRESLPASINFKTLTEHGYAVGRSPREAFFAASQTVKLEDSIGRISHELICPYPPGIPLIMPGETITPQAIADLRQVLALGGRITGSGDPKLESIQVID